MATRCRIGIKNKDGSVTSIYCHHDGYVKGGVGETLLKYYQDEEKINKLMDLGDMSSLGTEPISNPDGWHVSITKDFVNPENMCVTYESRGQDSPARIHRSIKAYVRYSSGCNNNYTYLFDNGEWFILKDNGLKEKLIIEDK